MSHRVADLMKELERLWKAILEAFKRHAEKEK